MMQRKMLFFSAKHVEGRALKEAKLKKELDNFVSIYNPVLNLTKIKKAVLQLLRLYNKGKITMHECLNKSKEMFLGIIDCTRCRGTGFKLHIRLKECLRRDFCRITKLIMLLEETEN